MRPEEIWKGFQEIKRVWPDAELSNSFQYIRINNFTLPRQFNYSSTPLLIKLDLNSDYTPPEAYVSSRLRIWDSYGWRKSRHLDELLTPHEFLQKGWVKLCVQFGWGPYYSLVDFLLMVVDFLENLKE